MGRDELDRSRRVLKDHKVRPAHALCLPAAVLARLIGRLTALPVAWQACFARHSSLGRDGAFTPRKTAGAIRCVRAGWGPGLPFLRYPASAILIASWRLAEARRPRGAP